MERHRILAGVGILLLWICPGLVLAYPFGNNGWHLNTPFQMRANADLVCKVRIREVRDVGRAPHQLIPGGPEIRSRLAEAEVLSVVKGECADWIEIEYQFPVEGDCDRALFGTGGMFTSLEEGETCLAFLKGNANPYRLSRIRCKARVVPSKVPYGSGDEPLLRLLAEFLAGLTWDEPLIRLQAAEEAGYLGAALMETIHPFDLDGGKSRPLARAVSQARQAIRPMRSSRDFVVRSAAIISSFQLADSPALKETLAILHTDSNHFGPAESKAMYGTDDFCVSAVQNRLLQMMDATTRRSIPDLENGQVIRPPVGRHGIYRGTPGFPYALFYRAALATEAVQRSEAMRRAIANVIWIRYERASVPEMILLLDDQAIDIRRTAVHALEKCIEHDLSSGRGRYQSRSMPGPSESDPPEGRLEDYARNEWKIIRNWKAWWAGHRHEFEGLDVD